jgi:preprotein translocase subunit SecF
VPFELIPSGTHIDFLGHRRICLVISLALVALGIAAVFARGGVPMGIDFVGGTEIQILFDEGVATDESQIREVVRDAGYVDATVVRFGEEGSSDYLIRFKADPEDVRAALRTETIESPDGSEQVLQFEAAEIDAPADGLEANTRVIRLEETLRGRIGDFTEQRVEFVGPKVGEELRSDGTNALLLSAIAILIYIAFRFNARYAPGAVVAVVHDLTITGGLLVMMDVEFDLRILAAMLAILGYSLNDSIIIYDRIRENLALHTTADLETVLNDSVNQTLSRTVLTSATTVIALLALYFLGGEVIRPFAFAMLIGVGVGTYSSIFIASPMLLFLEGRYRDRHDAGGKSGKRGSAKGKKLPART